MLAVRTLRNCVLLEREWLGRWRYRSRNFANGLNLSSAQHTLHSRNTGGSIKLQFVQYDSFAAL